MSIGFGLGLTLGAFITKVAEYHAKRSGQEVAAALQAAGIHAPAMSGVRQRKRRTLRRRLRRQRLLRARETQLHAGVMQAIVSGAWMRDHVASAPGRWQKRHRGHGTWRGLDG